MQYNGYDVIIIGGGILGSSLCYHLSSHKIPCVLVEQEQDIGLHASSKNSGMFRTLYDDLSLNSWANNSLDLLAAQLPGQYFQQTGSIIRQKTDSTICNIYSPRDGLLDSPLLMQTIAKNINKSFFCKLNLKQEALSITCSDKGYTVSNDSKAWHAKILVIATGAWTRVILDNSPQLKKYSSLFQPYQRHIVEIVGLPRQFMPIVQLSNEYGFYWDEVDNWYLRLFSNHSHLFSICDAIPTTHKSETQNVTNAVNHKLHLAFGNMAADIGIIRVWHCLRTYTPDLLPAWGQDPQYRGLFWCTGFGGFGMSTGWAAACDLAKLIYNTLSKPSDNRSNGDLRSLEEKFRICRF